MSHNAASLPLVIAALATQRASNTFIDRIQPILRERCQMCHNAELKEGGVDLSTREALLRGGKSGPAITPGNAAISLLYKLVTHQQEPVMPYKAEKLPQEIIASIAEWINAGAPYDWLGSTPVSGNSGAIKPAQDATTLFVQSVRPVLERECLKCHGGGAATRSGFDLSTREKLLRGGDSGPAVVPGDAQASLMYKRMKHEVQPGMPFQGKKLGEEVIARVEEWIDAGAPYDQPLKLSNTGDQVAAQALSSHWAFQPPKRAPIPSVKNRSWVRNSIDAFIAAEHEKRGLTPVPEVEKRVLLRRVYLDLVGIPPTPEEVQAFLADRSENAYEQVVNRLLASPLYGERWGRHWMDVWRYSDWYGSGEEVWNSQRHLWRWRDWIIESLNQDKGYDRMVVEMLAGDEIAPTDPNILRATGYLARAWTRFNRHAWLQEVVEHTSAAFLGITLKCARCHDHKFDPIAQEEYYRFRAFFEPYDVRIDRIPGQADFDKDGLARAFDASPREATRQRPFLPAIFGDTFRLIRGDDKNPDTSKPLSPGAPEVLCNTAIQIKPVTLPLEAYSPDIRSFVHQDLIAQAKEKIETGKEALEKAQQGLLQVRQRVSQLAGETAPGAASSGEDDPHVALRKAESTAALAEIQVMAAQADLPALEARIAADKAKFAKPPSPQAESLAQVALKTERQANLLKAEENLLRARQRLAEVRETTSSDEEKANEKVNEATQQVQAALDALGRSVESYTPIGNTYPETSSGRRLGLAQWIAGKQNPLTARVVINHLWLRHFGRALVPTVTNFGHSGQSPSHPDLLDWLAVEFMESGWSMKAMHRLMVTSSTYQMQSWVTDPKDGNISTDPENRYLWRMNPRRMEAEAVRDSVLYLARQLDTRLGGPEIDDSKGEEVHRRSLYFKHTPSSQMLFLKLFDAADATACYQRTESIVPQQALAMSNSQLSLVHARLLARHISRQTGENTSSLQFIQAAFETVLGRPATLQERNLSEEFLSQQVGLLQDRNRLTAFESGPVSTMSPAEEPQLRAREGLVHVLLNHNDFVTVR